ncbi:MAG: hypothetical protein IJB04_05790 [Oscillospiraceae bacterium]|nr:hypothetical protein [Oscillospiraceae bacterium]
MGAGLMVGAVVCAALLSRPDARKTAVGRGLQRVGNAVDQAVESVADMM